jgi:hypothetical protein
MTEAKTTHVRLLIDIEAEGVHIPAGTICEVEKYYPPHDGYHGCYDLLAGEVIFWVNEGEAEKIEP